MRELNYLVKIEDNEALLERFIEAIENGTIKIDTEYPEPYRLVSGEKFLLDSIVKYFFQTRPFSKDLYIGFIEKLRKLNGFRSYEYTLGNLTKDLICIHFDRVQKNNSKIFVPQTNEPQPVSILTERENELLSFLCYIAVCHIKYGPSYASVTANQYFDVVTALGSDEVERLKKYGTGKLPKELTEYKDSAVSCKANDVFATIHIKVVQESEESYKKALVFINNLLKSDFPKSYEIVFSSKIKELLPVKGLPKCGQNYLFAAAVKYPNLHSEIVAYIRLAQKKYEWYTNLEDENCATPSTFAVFAIGLESDAYFDLVINYFQTIDGEHQSIQQKFTPAFLEKFGVNEKSIQVFISAILSMQEHPHSKTFITHFTTKDSLNLLLDSKENFATYYFTEENLKEFSDSETSVQEMADYCWESVLYTIFGESKNFVKIAKPLNEEEKLVFGKLQLPQQ